MWYLSNNFKKIKNLNIIISLELENNYYNSFIGKNEKVLIERILDGYSYGHTTNYLYLKIPKELKENEIYDVNISKEMF